MRLHHALLVAAVFGLQLSCMPKYDPRLQRIGQVKDQHPTPEKLEKWTMAQTDLAEICAALTALLDWVEFGETPDRQRRAADSFLRVFARLVSGWPNLQMKGATENDPVSYVRPIIVANMHDVAYAGRQSEAARALFFRIKPERPDLRGEWNRLAERNGLHE